MKTDETEREQIRSALGALGDLAQPAPSFERLHGVAPQGNRHRRVWGLVAAAVAVVAATTTLLVNGGDRSREGVVAGPNPGTAPAPSWRRLPEPPLSPRNDTTAVWTGSEVIVVGGWEFHCPDTADCSLPDDEPFADGAAFDLEASTWRRIADAPFGFTTSSAVAIGGDAYILTDRALLRYRTDADGWDQIPLPPGDHGGQLVAAPELDALIVAAGSDEQGERPDWILDLLDTTRANWAALPNDPLPPSYDRSLVWDGTDILVFAKPLAQRPGSELNDIAGARLDLADGGTWTPLPESGTSGYQAWFVDGIVVVNPHFTGAGGGIFDPLTETWSTLPPHPAGDRWNNDMAGVVGREVAVLGDSGSWLLDVPAMRWIEVIPPDDTELDGVATAAGRARFLIGGNLSDPLALDTWLWTPPEPPVAPSEPPRSTPIPFASDQELRWSVVLVEANDVLNVRAEPRANADIVAALRAGAVGIVASSEVEPVEGEDWRQVLTPEGISGWVNDRYLTAQPTAFDDADASAMRDAAAAMFGWLQGDAGTTGPEAWLSEEGLWVGGVGIYLDMPTPFHRIPATELRQRATWEQPRQYPESDDFGDCEECVKSLIDFLSVATLGEAFTLDVDAIDPSETFGYGPSDLFISAHSVTADKPDSGEAVQDWQRITMWFEWSSGEPRAFAISTWAWTP